MKIKYLEINLEGESKSQIIFLKNNNLWFFISPKTKSRFFGGFLFYNNQAFRFLDDIDFNDAITEINILSPNEAILYFKNNQAYLNLQSDSLEITFSFWQNLKLTFDIKDIFKNEPFKRNIKIEKISSCFCVVEEFLEGCGLIKLSIETDSPLSLNNVWREKNMDFDKMRNSPPYSWWIYDGIEGKVREVKIKILHPDRTNRTNTEQHRMRIINTEESEQTKNISKNSVPSVFVSDNSIFSSHSSVPSLSVSVSSVLNFFLTRINSLILDSYLPAGFPWFYENWFRDELLSLYLLKLTYLPAGKQGTIAELTQNYANIKSFFNQRIKFYLYNLENIWDKNKFQNSVWDWPAADTFLLFLINLPQDLLLTHFTLVEKYFSLWQKKFNLDNLPSFSTWMDTLERKDALEIDVLFLKALRRLVKINKNYIDLANKTKERIIKKIKENPVDTNLIFAYLFLEDIFSKAEWKNFFAKLISENYLDWACLDGRQGGIATLPKNHPNFKNEDDGELAQAYHQGDSWYYLNNLLAFCLNKINSQYFKNLIHQIIKSSLEDLFFDGALGWSSEISSAKERKSEGSLVQLWSMASLVLLTSSFQNINIFLKS